jgi:hypothetical protein
VGAVHAAQPADDCCGRRLLRREDHQLTAQPDPAPLLAALAGALTACERAGLKPKLRHGGIIETRRGYVVRAGPGWVARTAEWTEFSSGEDGD